MPRRDDPGPVRPLEILNRLRAGTWREADVVWPIELGLVGAGMQPVEKNKIVAEFVRDVPKGELVPLAARILFAAIYGVEPLKKEEGSEAKGSGRARFSRAAAYGAGAVMRPVSSRD